MRSKFAVGILLSILIGAFGVSQVWAENPGLVPSFEQPVPKSPGSFTVYITNFDPNYQWQVSTTLGQVSLSDSGVITVAGLNYGEIAVVSATTSHPGSLTNTKSVSGSSNILFAGKVPSLANTASTADGFTAQIANYDPIYTWQISTNHGSAKIDSQGFISVSGLTSGSPATVSVTASRLGYLAQTSTFTSTALGYSSDQDSGTGATNNGILVPVFGDPTSILNGFTVQILNYDSSYNYVFSSTNGAVQLQNGGVLLISNLKPSQTSVVTVITTKNGVKPGSSNVAGASLAGGTQPVTPSPEINPPLIPHLVLTSKNSHGFAVQVSNYDKTFLWTCVVTAPSQCQIAYGGVINVINVPQNLKTILTVTSSKNLNGQGSTDFIQDYTGNPVDSFQPKVGSVRPQSQGFTFQIINYDSRITYVGRSSNGTVKIDNSGNVSLMGLTPNKPGSVRLYSTFGGIVKGTITVSGNSLNLNKK